MSFEEILFLWGFIAPLAILVVSGVINFFCARIAQKKFIDVLAKDGEYVDASNAAMRSRNCWVCVLFS